MGKQPEAVTKKGKKPEIDEEENAEPVKKQKGANGDGNKVAKAQTKLAPKAEAKVTKKAAKGSDSEESDESPAPVKKGKAPAKHDSESEEESPKAKSKPVAAKKPKHDDDEEEKAPAKKGGEGEHEVFVKGLSYDADEDALRELFAECGTISNINLLKNDQGRSKGIAFIKFEDADALEGAVAFNGTEHMGRTLQVEKSRPKGDRAPRQEFSRGGGDGESSTVFVGNLSYSTTEDGLYDFFGAHGEVKAVRLAKLPDGKLKGFAHVEFADASSAADAVSKNGTELDGRQIKVDLAGKRPPGGGGGGFGGGRGGGGFRGGRGGGGGGGFRGGRGRY